MATQDLCSSFTDFLVRRNPHYDKDLIKDIRPRDGWIGHFNTGVWPAGTGVEMTQDRLHVAYPDLSGCWEDVPAGSCVGAPCDPTETRVGFGYSRTTYSRQRKSFATDILCFDNINTADAAQEQFSNLISKLREITSTVVSDRMKTEALRIAGTKVISDSTLTPLTFTTNDDCTIITPNALPDSKITMAMLMRQLEPLKLNGYFGENGDMMMLAEYVTDVISGYGLVQGNPELNQFFRFTDFEQGGKLYKYGLVNAVGNFGLRYDPEPMRYQDLGDGRLQRVFPYVNTAATQGLKNIVNDAYVNAPYQIDFIWNRMASTMLTATMESVNPLMPFAKRDLGGKWQFVMDNLGTDPRTGCVVDNKRRNKGQFIADFDMATRTDHPEWIVAILTRREPQCIVPSAPCSDVPVYVTQDYSSANDLCDNAQYCFDLTDISAPYQISDEDGTITCNGVPVSHSASGSLADLDAVAEWLNSNADQLGTWSVDGSSVCLNGSTCTSVNVVVTQYGV